MESSKLPQSVNELCSSFQNKSFLDFLYISQNPDQVPTMWKYCGGALLAGRPLDTAMIFMAGITGTGKSSTINVLFNDPDLCPTNKRLSETKEPVMFQKELHVTSESGDLVGHLTFVDVSGTFDTDIKNEAKNLAAIRKFTKSRVELCSRKEFAEVYSKKGFEIRESVFPNLVLFTANANDKRMAGPDSFFRKSLEVLKKTENIIDIKCPNLIIVLTHAMGMSPKRDKFEEELQGKVEDIREIVAEVLGIYDVDVIPVDNNGEDYDLEKVGEFYKLPNGEVSHHNLFEAMLKRFGKNKDDLGRLLVQHYFTPECPERSNKARVIQCHLELSPTELAFAGRDLQMLKISVDDESIVPEYTFQSLGYGYCPVTEQIKPVNLLNLENKDKCGEKLKVVEINNAKFLIPECVTAFVEKASRFRKVSFYEKDDYQNHMMTSYGIDVGYKLIVKVSSEGRWVRDRSSSSSSSIISLVQEVQVANFKMENPKMRIKNEKFFEELNALPREYSDKTAKHFNSFFSKWGTHLICEQAVGGAIQLDCSLEQTSLSERKLQEIEAEVSGIFKTIIGGVGAGNSVGVGGLRAVGITNEHFQVVGGDPPPLVTLDMVNSPKLKEWAESVAKNPAELRRSMKLYPYYNFLENGDRYDSLHQATKDFMKDSLDERIRDVYQTTRERNDSYSRPSSSSSSAPTHYASPSPSRWIPGTVIVCGPTQPQLPDPGWLGGLFKKFPF